MTSICVSLNEETTAGICTRMSELGALADMFEVRGDLVFDLDLLTILRAKTKPLLFCCRPISEGGRYAGSEERRRLLLLEAVKRGYDYVDVEYRCEHLDVMMEKSGAGLVISYHDLDETPGDLDDLYARMCEKGADIVKIAVTPRSVTDVGRLLEFARRTGNLGGPPLVPIALGPLGLITRLAAGRYGTPFTYASSAAGAEVAPGQVPVALMADLYRVRDHTQATRVYGILGTDITRSQSPAIHNRALEARGIDAVYVPLQAEALAPFIQALPGLELSGFSVTRPFKTEILPYLQEVEETAAQCGSVNTVVVREDGSLQGSTSDGRGVVAPLRKLIDLRGKAAVIVGAGGAARAAALALQRKGAQVCLLARDPERARAAAAAIGCHGDALANLGAQRWDLLINATPLGSHAFPDQTPVPAELHRPGTIVFDMVYDPPATRLLREARDAGCTVVEGIEMLLAQAVAQFEAWTGVEAPLDVLKAVALFLAQQHEEERA